MENTMKFIDLAHDFGEILADYDNECHRNYGHEGTVKSLILRAQLDQLIRIAQRYYGKVLDYTRHI